MATELAPAGTRRPHQRFTRTERVLHWTHATAFFTLLATGLILYLPALSTLISRRQLVKNVHIWVAVAWAIAIVVIIVAGNRKRLAEDWREIETIDRDDRRWLTGRRTPQGRFNAGQKINALLTVAFALLFALSGFFLWLGERDHRFIFDGTGTVHDILTFLSVGPARRAPLPGADPPEHAPRAPRHDHRRGRRVVGPQAPREVGRGGEPAATALASPCRSIPEAVGVPEMSKSDAKKPHAQEAAARRRRGV